MKQIPVPSSYVWKIPLQERVYDNTFEVFPGVDFVADFQCTELAVPVDAEYPVTQGKDITGYTFTLDFRVSLEGDSVYTGAATLTDATDGKLRFFIPSSSTTLFSVGGQYSYLLLATDTDDVQFVFGRGLVTVVERFVGTSRSIFPTPLVFSDSSGENLSGYDFDFEEADATLSVDATNGQLIEVDGGTTGKLFTATYRVYSKGGLLFGAVLGHEGGALPDTTYMRVKVQGVGDDSDKFRSVGFKQVGTECKNWYAYDDSIVDADTTLGRSYGPWQGDPCPATQLGACLSWGNANERSLWYAIEKDGGDYRSADTVPSLLGEFDYSETNMYDIVVECFAPIGEVVTFRLQKIIVLPGYFVELLNPFVVR